MQRKKAIVTGGSTGIGRGIVQSLAQAGYDVVFSYRNNEESAQNVLDELCKGYPEGTFKMVAADFGDKDATKPFFKKAIELLGGLDLLVNNAGVTLKNSIFDLDEREFDTLVQVDFRNYVFMMKEAVTYMAANQIKGSVVNITSSRAERAYPGDSIYGAVKAGMNRAIKSVALDVAPYGIRVNNIAPGATMRLTAEEMASDRYKESPHVQKIAYLSSRIPLSRYGTPADIGDAVVFLASDKASYITGETICIDGGLTLPGMPETKEESENGWGASARKIIWRT